MTGTAHSGTMRAVRIVEHGEPESMRVVDAPIPSPGPGEVRVRVHAAGVNYPDLLVVRGTYQILAPLPFSPGKEVAGVISAAGPGVAGLAVGDRVLGIRENGCYAEEVVIPAATCFRLPDAMGFDLAAAFGLTYQTAWFALKRRARFQPGERVLVTGATGGVGTAAIGLVKAWGGVALAGVSGPHRAASALAAGADAVVDLSRPDLGESLRAQVESAAGGGRADIVIENIGGAVFDAAIRALDWDGRIVVVGFAGAPPASIRSNYLLIRNIAAAGLNWNFYRDNDSEGVRAAQQEMFDLWSAGRLRPPPLETFPLERASEALSRMAKRSIAGKLVLTTRVGRGETENEALEE